MGNAGRGDSREIQRLTAFTFRCSIRSGSREAQGDLPTRTRTTMREDLLIPGIEHGVRPFLSDCEEARPCFERARALAMERCTEPETWEKLLGASDEEIEQVAERHGPNAAVIIVVESCEPRTLARRSPSPDLRSPGVLAGQAASSAVQFKINNGSCQSHLRLIEKANETLLRGPRAVTPIRELRPPRKLRTSVPQPSLPVGLGVGGEPATSTSST